MFKKKPQIKNLSPLKSSERRKLADQIRRDYGLQDPSVDIEASDANGAANSQTTQTLTSLRNTLLPDGTSSAKFSTTHGPNSSLVTGTVYVGTHAGQEERILWFQIGNDQLIPTVYTLWHNPNLVPLLHIGESVVGKLQGGADLFAPGLIRPSHGYDERAVNGAIVAVAGHKSDTVPRWVGRAKQNISSLQENATGSAAEGVHWDGDELWAWSALNKGGTPAPEEISGWRGLSSTIEEAVETLAVDDDPEPEHTEGGVTIDGSTAEEQVIEEHIPTTQEVDDAFVSAFLYSIYNAKKTHSSEPYGFDFPIQPSFLIANMIQPHLRVQSPHYNIKKTSWKNTKKFIKHLDKQVLVKSKDRNGGETVILDIDFNDQAIKSFQAYKLPKSKTETTEDTKTDDATDASLGQKLSLSIVYRASSKLVPDLLPSKTTFYTAQQITSALKQYIEANPDLVNESKKRYIKLNPFLANSVLGSHPDDAKAFKAGEIDRAILNKRIVEDDHLCQPHHILLRNDQTLGSDPTLKPKSGPAPKVTMTIEKRGGNKVVTAIAGLENFFINPHVVRPELQKKCAGSASVGQHVGGKPGMLEVQVQGDQRAVVEKEILAKRGVRPEWIEVIDKSKKKK